MFYTEMEFRRSGHPISVGVYPRRERRVKRCDLGVRRAVSGTLRRRKPAPGKRWALMRCARCHTRREGSFE